MDSGFQGHFLELVARERSGHTAVVEGSLLYVWGGYMVRNTHRCQLISPQCSNSAANTTADTTGEILGGKLPQLNQLQIFYIATLKCAYICHYECHVDNKRQKYKTV